MAEPSSSDDVALTDIELLQAAWINELRAPELLPHEHELVLRVKEQVAEQEARVEELDERDSLLRSLYEMDNERTNYQLRSYLRTRLEKLTKMAIFIARRQGEADAEARPLLSRPEQNFLGKYLALYQDHIDAEANQSPSRFTFHDEVVELQPGDTVLLPYEPIRHLVLDGSVQLT
ncbi:hypothetical protein EMIHUDRAFT_456157 [Emiliania huxleyi CCMP1516]|uniref:DNA replication complex GINS protein SLD5 n=2 Tax=Emiliania huxleyi TaxID=2903 RepID=A0A0D3K851_EMIH1|nr:hypothetical protein EMIHUDRAFT_456157 [Emiliania huxleyi CCMP1516]EOD31936.1 hypothetical protein EMIHUDRAFT_456157 [Emiliania huxleyi CCMP1516]|eukprot:XP_005784365.1 hypothetical protein EMIHUDRAFT_456157 [Emiliania huxleyi CCMP1516]